MITYHTLKIRSAMAFHTSLFAVKFLVEITTAIASGIDFIFLKLTPTFVFHFHLGCFTSPGISISQKIKRFQKG